jgi:hypothetical protein
MDDIFKRNIRTTLIFMLAGAVFTGLNLMVERPLPSAHSWV